jgi:predicted permease
MFSRRRRYRELAESMREHIDERVEELVGAGVPRRDAEFRARKEFGNMTRIEEQGREVWQWPRIESVWADVRFALRQMRKSPGFAAVVIVTLALGIGANTAVFSIVDAVVLRPLPYVQPERLVEVRSRASGGALQDGAVSYPDFFDWRKESHSFEELVSYHDASLTLTGVDRPAHLTGEVVSWGLVPLLGINPELGHGFRPEDEKPGAHAVLISHALWVAQYGSDPGVVGRTIHLSGEAFTIVGVMPASFRFPVNAPKNDFWTTLAMDDDGTPRSQTANRGDHEMAVMGRLKPGVSAEAADAEMKTIAAQLARQYPDTNTRTSSAHVQSELASMLGDTREVLLTILGAVGLVLLIACGNVGNLLLARAREREREMAMRSAVGANRGRLVRQMLVESMVLGVLGGVAGCALAFAATPVALRLIGESLPRAADAGVNLPVLAFALAASLMSGVMFGLAPALQLVRVDLLSPLQSGGRGDIRGQHRLGSAVIVGQVAVGIVLTAAAGLLVTSYVHLTHNDEGFNPDHVLTLGFETPDARYAHKRPAFYQEYFEKVRALPGVEAAGGSIILPMTDNSAHISFENPEHPLPKGQQEGAMIDVVSDGYFHTMQIPLLAGRDFTVADTETSPQVMIVSQAFAEKFFHGENALGKKLKPGTGNGKPPEWREIVGVVGDIRHGATARDLDPTYYLPASQLSVWCCMTTVVRTATEPRGLEPQMRSVVASMDPDIPVTDVHTMEDLIGLQLATPRFTTVLLGAFAVLALLLTVVGLYGVMAYSVARRTREIGVRLALGAQRGMVLTMVLRQAALLVAMGMVLGIAGALASGPMLRSMLYGTGARNPVVLAGVCALVAVTGSLAAYLPAWRAASVDPMKALRAE